MASNDEVISTLNNLIETCRDGQNGFQTAAEGVEGSTLKTLFLGYSQQRAAIRRRTSDEVRRLGGTRRMRAAWRPRPPRVDQS